MKSLMRYCKKCDRYTFEDSCPVCSSPTVQPIPPRFSPQDRYGRYRRMRKKELMSG